MSEALCEALNTEKLFLKLEQAAYTSARASETVEKHSSELKNSGLIGILPASFEKFYQWFWPVAVTVCCL